MNWRLSTTYTIAFEHCCMKRQKVRTAAQLSSRTTADEICYLFQDKAKMAHFLELVNDAFDILNTNTCIKAGHFQKTSAYRTHLTIQEQNFGLHVWNNCWWEDCREENFASISEGLSNVHYSSQRLVCKPAGTKQCTIPLDRSSEPRLSTWKISSHSFKALHITTTTKRQQRSNTDFDL